MLIAASCGVVIGASVVAAAIQARLCNGGRHSTEGRSRPSVRGAAGGRRSTTKTLDEPTTVKLTLPGMVIELQCPPDGEDLFSTLNPVLAAGKATWETHLQPALLALRQQLQDLPSNCNSAHVSWAAVVVGLLLLSARKCRRCRKVAASKMMQNLISGCGTIRGERPAPQSIFHALHVNFADLKRMVPQLAADGFDAVQIPPAQVSRPGDLRHQWYQRYQPLRYGEIDPNLGGEDGLRDLCEEATSYGILVIADCVFNHMAVVASKDEWEAAQSDDSLFEELQGRLDNTFYPEFDRNDFQWPWVCLEGHKWDDPHYMYEGWGCGEWSELRWCRKVLDVHFGHLQLLLDAGVRGFRLDAGKHMRPGHVSRYAKFLEAWGAYVYVEVLSLSQEVHAQYEPPTTDYLFASSVREAARPSDASSILPRLAAAKGVGSGGVRFARTHDTVLNPGDPICGLDWHNASHARCAWTYLLAMPESSVLIYSEDAKDPTVRRALAFRRAITASANSRQAGCFTVTRDGTLERKRAVYDGMTTKVVAWPPPEYSLILVVINDAKGEPLGLVALNFTSRSSALHLPDHFHSLFMAEVHGGCSPQYHLVADWKPSIGEYIACQSSSSVTIHGNDSRCFLFGDANLCKSMLARSTSPLPHRMLMASQSKSLRFFTLLYCSGWKKPHIHFCVNRRWTEAPGWPMRASGPPPAAAMVGAISEGTRWWIAEIPVAGNEDQIEFVVNDGDEAWDKPPPPKKSSKSASTTCENYLVHAAGTYILSYGHLARMARTF